MGFKQIFKDKLADPDLLLEDNDMVNGVTQDTEFMFFGNKAVYVSKGMPVKL